MKFKLTTQSVSLPLNKISGQKMYHSIPVRSLYLTFLDPLPTNHKILDVGCGSGYVMEALEGLGNNVSGLDRSLPLVSALVENGLRAETYTLGSFRGFKGQSFDLILCFDVLEHVAKRDRPAFLNELFSWKTPTNSLLFSLPTYTSHGDPPDFAEFREHLGNLPYKIGRIHYPAWYVLIQRLKAILRRLLKIQEFPLYLSSLQKLYFLKDYFF